MAIAPWSSTIVTFPERPVPRTTLARICLELGLHIDVGSTAYPAAAVFYWLDQTFRPTLPNVIGIYNGACTNIAKSLVAARFEQVFGYALAVDPFVHVGLCVRKSELNGRHDGEIVRCPQPRQPDQTYQLVIDNRCSAAEVEDLRVPVLLDIIPFVYCKRRPLPTRFSNANSRVLVTETSSVLNANETDAIVRFCRLIGMDFGELDVLRDRASGRIFIVDANATPFGPPAQLATAESAECIRRLAREFDAAFVRRRSAAPRVVPGDTCT
jgi:hypothetical protein